MNSHQDSTYKVIFNELKKATESKRTVYTISTESQNIKELRRLSDQLNRPQPSTYSFS